LSGLTVEQFLEDLQDLEWIIKSMPHDGQKQLDALAARYQLAPAPPQDHRASMWYRMRLLSLDWSENWKRLAFYLAWRGDNNETLDGTNNGTEQITLALAVTQGLGLDNVLKSGIARCAATNGKSPFAR
jgi:hypothetical protein